MRALDCNALTLDDAITEEPLPPTGPADHRWPETRHDAVASGPVPNAWMPVLFEESDRW
ncbi:hypothetical protein [Actinomadura soli]|uniref:hypothetical protein n=1 Tax=Actinomadura soli TaxID=2508997 RepID=UPI001486DFF1|nr:hypothetical protein [Actinomadura soli]